jgi:hypothetical protein
MYMDVYHDPAPSYIFVKARNDLPLDPEFERILRYTINNELVEYHVRVARGEKPEDIRSKSQTRHQAPGPNPESTLVGRGNSRRR